MFELTKPKQTLGSVIENDTLPMPEEARLSEELLRLLQDLPVDMRLNKIGCMTPWAIPAGGGEWEEFSEAPGENLELFELPAEMLPQAHEKLFGQPIPYVGLLTRSLPTEAELDIAFEGTEYEPVETIAVYSQKDTQSVPDVRYFHWLAMRPLGTRKTKNMPEAIAKVKGALVFAQRVPYWETVVRAHPAVSFSFAQGTGNTDGIGENITIAPEMVIEGKVKPIVPSWWAILGIGAAAAGLTVFLVQISKGKKR